ncbi:hypothetical protein KK141_11455 [Dyella sp. LX-66]|uniref:hypothetical protein n=1 Tax=unclassified Dyella TaxID=2634549 RepID=UPI001BE02076|nr:MULTISPECIES: hypothetical protein [unclassified Dyella]MBT2118860.1 hypothetical protein [Dyella sp. LX-1]MBT2140147.1 hypothetical protein [Dyella sp. LX-66]
MSATAMHGVDHAQAEPAPKAVRRRAGCLHPVVLAVFIASTMSACGVEPWQERPSGRDAASVQREGGDAPPSPAPMPAQTFPIEPVDAERKARKARAAAAVSSRQARRAKQTTPTPDEPALEDPELTPPETAETPVAEAAPATAWVDPLAAEEVATPDLAPPLPPGAEAGANPVAWLVVASCSVLGVFILWRRRRERQRRRRREAWTPIRWGGPKLIRPHWDYDPGQFDSDAFLRRWDSIGLSISGEWRLLLAIAGRIAPHASQFAGWRRAVARPRPLLSFRPDWHYLPFAGDAAETLARWCRLGLSIHGDALQASMVGGQLEWVFEMDAGRIETPVEPFAQLPAAAPEEPAEVVVDALPRDLVAVPSEDRAWQQGDAQDMPAEISSPMRVTDEPLASGVMDAEPESSQPIVEAVAPVACEITAAPQEEQSGTSWLSRLGSLLKAWESQPAPELEAELWGASRRLSAHAAALPPAARAPWLDAVEALAERMVRSVPAASRGAWQAHWVDLRLERLGAMNGAWRLLELRALDDACAGDGAPEVIEARIRLLQLWADALLGPAAKAKRVEAAALAASLRPAHAASA